MSATTPTTRPATRRRPVTRAARWRFVRDLLTVALGLGILLALAFPIIWVALTSIRPDSALFSDSFDLLSEQLTLDSYRSLLEDSTFPTYIRNSILVCVIATAISMAVALLAAYGFSRHRRFRWRSTLLILVIATQLFPFVILITPIYAIFFRLGLTNSFIGLIVSYVAISMPFSIYMLLGYLDTIPRELDEAAVIDGTSTLGVIFRIILPVAWPGLVTVGVYSFVSMWDEFLFALTFMTDDDRKTVPVGLASFFGEYTAHWNLVKSASVIATLPTLVLFMIIQKKLVSDLAAGAVKQ
jgi:ABC-type glycerol-3-phosphate transport system permease component